MKRTLKINEENEHCYEAADNVLLGKRFSRHSYGDDHGRVVKIMNKCNITRTTQKELLMCLEHGVVR